MSRAGGSRCKHPVLQLEPSPFAELAGFERPEARARLAATIKSGRAPPISKKTKLAEEAETLARAFPAPLVLPHDALNYDPEEPAQSFRSWMNEKARNKVTEERKTLYVAAPPSIHARLPFMREWMRPNIRPEDPPAKKVKRVDEIEEELIAPGAQDTIEYLRAFYHGLEVKEFDLPLEWVPWEQNKKRVQNGIPNYVALKYGDSATRVRARKAKDGVFPVQLNLDDILDAAIRMLPKDAYSIVLLVHHDIYENDDDDFCCGRAYGGSRVCVVQSARYSPLLDETEGIAAAAYEHVWPMSHCKDYVDKLCAVEDVVPKPASKKEQTLSGAGALRAAIDAASDMDMHGSRQELEGLWFSRVARTVSHELGHCLCLAHCVYYACNMQSTAGMKEDIRQPPYLCPVCEAKIEHAVAIEQGGSSEYVKGGWTRERNEKLRAFCAGESRRDVVLWQAFGHWLDKS